MTELFFALRVPPTVSAYAAAKLALLFFEVAWDHSWHCERCPWWGLA